MPVAGCGEYVFQWKLQNYSTFYDPKGDIVCSPFFEIEELYGSEWRLEIYPNSWKFDNFLACFLKLINAHGGVQSVTIDYYAQIIDSDGGVLIDGTKFKGVTFNKNNRKTLGILELMDNSKLIKELSKRELDTLTVHCLIKSDELKNSKLSGSEGLTTFNVDRSVIIWDVILPTVTKYSECTTFSISNLYNFEIILSYVLNYVDITIHLLKYDAGQPLKVTFEFALIDKIGSKLKSERACLSFAAESKQKFANFITGNDLKACTIGKDYYEFQLKCDAYTSRNSYDSSLVKKYSLSPSFDLTTNLVNIQPSALEIDFRNIFVSKKDSDIVIRCDNAEFPVHKFVLRARSPVFDAMFDQNMFENRTGVIEINDADSLTLKDFLKYLYTGTLDVIDFEIAKKLIIVAEKYQVPSLVDECAIYMKSILSVENVCEIISISYLINCDYLKSSSLEFIRVNTSTILSSFNWSQLIEENVKVATYILSKLSADICQKSIEN